MGETKIGFPPNTLCAEAVRLDVIETGDGYFAVNKPAGVLLEAYPAAPKTKSLVAAIRENLKKPEFARLSIASPYSVNQLDFETSGAAIIACGKDSAARLRNAMWSGEMFFEYLVLARGGSDKGDDFSVDLPLLKHERRDLWIVSHRFGKKAQTHFKKIAESRGFTLWRARAAFARPHQIRAHAKEAGLRVAGENVYSRTSPVYMSEIKREQYKLDRSLERELPLYPHICIHLENANGARAPLPKGFAAALKRLGLSS